MTTDIINSVSNSIIKDGILTTDDYNDVIKALEKQIPKKVKWEKDHTWGIPHDVPVCPVCDGYIVPVEFFGEGEHCSWCDSCGQKLRWNDD